MLADRNDIDPSPGNIRSDLRGPCRLGLALSWIVRTTGGFGSKINVLNEISIFSMRLEDLHPDGQKAICQTFSEPVQLIYDSNEISWNAHWRFATDELLRRDSRYSSALFVLVFTDVRRRLFTKSSPTSGLNAKTRH